MSSGHRAHLASVFARSSTADRAAARVPTVRASRTDASAISRCDTPGGCLNLSGESGNVLQAQRPTLSATRSRHARRRGHLPPAPADRGEHRCAGAGKVVTDAVIVAVHVRSVVKEKVAWYSTAGLSGESLEQLVRHVASELRERRVALGFECPTWVPVPRSEHLLGSRRSAEPSTRAWSASAGATSMATGLVQICWVLRELGSEFHRPVNATVRKDRWRDGFFTPGTGLLLWEAMVTGGGKGSGHDEDARRAVQAFLSSRGVASRGDPRTAFNALVAAGLWAGLSIRSDEFASPGVVYRAK